MNKLILLKECVSINKYRSIKDLYLCVCGKQFETRRSAVVSGHTKSCGCLKPTLLRNALSSHGRSRTSEFHTWQQMIQRCENTSNCRYKYYGGRGISVCARWRNSFELFIKDMGKRPKGKSIDRINNDGNYEPNNCRWADIKTQNNNKRQRGKA